MNSAVSPHIRKAWDWYRGLGSPRYVVAPMVHASELAFRLQTRKHGAELAYTPMLNVNRWFDNKKYGKLHFFSQTAPGDEPLVAQIAGSDPDLCLRVGLDLQDHVTAVDLNLGCPQQIARRGNYGAFLLPKTELLVRIVSTMAQGLSVPVTCKIRLLEAGLDATIDLVLALQDAGASLITVHGRTKVMLQDRLQECDWDAIRTIKDVADVPIFANGGIEVFEDVQRCIDYTGVDGVMVSEAIYERPDFFSGTPYSPQNQDVLVREYLEYARDHPAPTMRFVRAHLFKMLHTGLQAFPDQRRVLAKCKSIDDFVAFAERFAKLREHEYTCPLSADACSETHSVPTTWYRRHRRQPTAEEEDPAKVRARAKLAAAKQAAPTEAAPTEASPSEAGGDTVSA